MPISLECPGCRKPYRLREELAGKRMKCRVCDTMISIPGTAQNDDDFKESRRDSDSHRRSEPRRSRPADADRFDDNDYGHSHDDGDDDFQLPPQRVRRRKTADRPRRRKKSRNRDSSKNMVAIILGCVFAFGMLILIVGGGIALVVNRVDMSRDDISSTNVSDNSDNGGDSGGDSGGDDRDGSDERKLEKHREFIRDMTAHSDKGTAVLKPVHDATSAAIAATKMDRLYKDLGKLKERNKELPSIGQTERNKLGKEKITLQLMQSSKRFGATIKTTFARSQNNRALEKSMDRYMSRVRAMREDENARNAKLNKNR